MDKINFCRSWFETSPPRIYSFEILGIYTRAQFPIYSEYNNENNDD